MKTRNLIAYRRLVGIVLLTLCFCLSAYAQEGLQIATLFEKYKNEKNVTYVELNGSILRSYRMTAYKSLVFEEVTPYKKEIMQCLKQAIDTYQVQKTQEVNESGELLSAYYRLSRVTRKGKKVNRYILYKVGKQQKATLVYIEGPLDEDELMEMLYKQ
ncbi:DUF6108 family protein [uncultured Mediterranea sp.]|uniref:DUF6108 family protein n=1 Tax=uncultured Mediterranea sp. TaxID=1926662 RepID=UPI00258905FC|nr:DUF6108 family protein [uncultured Mediterranea sp.]